MSLANRLKELLSGTPSDGSQGAPSVSKPANGQLGAIKEGAQNPDNKAAAGNDPEKMYAEIWGQAPKPEPGSQKLFNTDQQKFSEAVNGMDFTKHVPKDVMEKVLTGDANALMQVINRVGQMAFSTATMSSREMIEHANSRSGQSMNDQIKEIVRATLAESQAVQRNPSFSDPTVAPLLKEISGRLRAKFPEASPDELVGKSEEMLMAIAQKIVAGSPKERDRQKQQQEVSSSQNFDWEAWASAPTGQMDAGNSGMGGMGGMGGSSQV